jgi:hypothetical protein
MCRYSEEQADELVVQMLDLADEAEFVIHVGDLRSAEDEDFRCRRTDYSDVAKMLRLSHAARTCVYYPIIIAEIFEIRR